MYADAAVSPRETDTTEKYAKYAAQYIHEQRIHTECLEKHAPLLIAFHINNPDKQCQKTGCQSASDEYVGRRPYFLVDGATVA